MGHDKIQPSVNCYKATATPPCTRVDLALQKVVRERPVMEGGRKLLKLLIPVLGQDFERTVRVLYVDTHARLTAGQTIFLEDGALTLLDAHGIYRQALANRASGFVVIYHFPGEWHQTASAISEFSAKLYRMEDDWGMSVIAQYVVSDAGWLSQRFGLI